MSATLKFRWDLEILDAGRPEPVPGVDLVRPVKEVTIPGDFRAYDEIVLPAWDGTADPTVLWEWQRRDAWQVFIAQVVGGEGYAHLAWKIDKPVSAEDFTPESEQAVAVNTWRRTCHADLSCYTPFVLNAVQSLVHPTLATGAGFDADGFPAILTSGSTVAGRIARIWGRNNSLTADIRLRLWVRN